MNSLWALRLFKLFVIFGIPALGVVYAYQFTNQPGTGGGEEIVPFRPFRMPNSVFAQSGAKDSGVALALNAPITVVNYWATWCPPCVEEFPAMLELERQVKDKGVEFVFVSVDQNWADVEKFVATYLRGQAPARLLWDPERKGAVAWGSTKFPETYVVRQDGWVVEKIIGLQMWTRPIVVKYFMDLGEKFKGVSPAASASFLDLIVPVAHAQKKAWTQAQTGKEAKKEEPKDAAKGKDDNGLGTAPIIHEQDKKNIEKLKKNIETATQNLQKAEGALKEEERNLKEQQVVLERRKKEQANAEEDLTKIQAKATEVEGVITRTKNSLATEQAEKKKIEGEIEDIRKRIADLEKRLDRAKDDLTQANKGLNSRVSNIETLEKAEESSKDELSSLKGQVDKAKSLARERKGVSDKADSEIKKREKRKSEIESEVAKAKKALEEQKKTLDEFEKILRK